MSRPQAAWRLRPELAFWGSVVVMWLLFTAVAWLAPLQDRDWSTVVWAARGVTMDRLRDHLAAAPTTGDLALIATVTVDGFHLLVSPAVVVALFLGVVTHVLGRLPRPGQWRDTLILWLTSSVIWFTAPRAGVILFNRANLAQYVYGLTCLVWFLAVFRLAGSSPRGGRGRAAGMLLLGLLAGASNLHIATVALLVIGIELVRRRRTGAMAAWMWTGLAGLVAGAALTWIELPGWAPRAFVLRGFTRNFTMLYPFFGECGQIVSVVAVVLLLVLARHRLRLAPFPPLSLGELVAIRSVLLLSLLVALVGVLGPYWGETMLFAPSLGMAVAAMIALAALLEDRWVRRAAVATVAVHHALIAVAALSTYSDIRGQVDARLRAMRAAAPGAVARVAPMAPIDGTSWALGEDWAAAAVRERVAREVFGLRGIDFASSFAAYEPAPNFAFEIRWEIEPGATVASAAATVVSYTVENARRELEEDAAEVRTALGPRLRGAALYLRLDVPDLADRGEAESAGGGGPSGSAGGAGGRGPRGIDRPIIAARLRGDRAWWPEALPRGTSTAGRRVFRVENHAVLAEHPEAWVVCDGEAQRMERHGDDVEFFVWRAGWFTMLLCSPSECLVQDSIHLRP